MKELVKTNQAGRDVTTSLIVAEVFGKEHKNVVRDIESLNCSDGFNKLNFEPIEYIDSKGRKQKAYEITKDGFTFLVMGYTGEKAGQFKETFINEFNKREALLRNDDYIINRAMILMNNKAKALEQRVHQQNERLCAQEDVIKRAKPKVDYYDEVLQSEGMIAISVIAKELNISAVRLNKFLYKQGVQYQCNGTWLLYSAYQDKGYTKTRTVPYTDEHGNIKTNIHTYWTEKGRKFIHNLWRKRNGRPLKLELN